MESTADSQPPTAGDSSGSGRVLVCDDERRLGQLTAGLLRQHGFAAEAVSDGAVAIERARHEPAYDVLLLDLNLDGLTSREVVAELAESKPQIRVILTSGYSAEDVPPELMSEPNVAGYLPKPYPVESLVSSVRSALAR